MLGGGYRERARERICNKQNKPPVHDESTILNSKTLGRKTMAKEKGERKKERNIASVVNNREVNSQEIRAKANNDFKICVMRSSKG